jgi:hypothetical protein
MSVGRMAPRSLCFAPSSIQAGLSIVARFFLREEEEPGGNRD